MANINSSTALSLGFFDSIHRGHRYLLQVGKKIASYYNAEFTVMTFDDNFNTALGREEKEVYLLSERLEILKSLGYDKIVVFESSTDFLNMDAEKFLRYLLTYNPIAIIAGNDYTFGKGAKGDIGLLKSFMKEHNVNVAEVDLLNYYNSKISTSRIKRFLLKGEIAKANKLLGDRYFVSGTVTKGKGLGNKLGIPTANIVAPKLKFLPKDGVYKTSVQVDGKTYDSITNVGTHPTFNDHSFNLETFILNYDGNLYNKKIKISFIDRLRDVIKFNSVDELVKQINSDIVKAYQT